MGVPFQKYYTLLKDYLAPFKGQVIILTVLMLSQTAIMIVNPQIIRYYIDVVTSENPILSRLTFAAFLYIFFALIQQILTVATVYSSQSVAWNSTNVLRSRLLRHAMDLDMDFHNKYKPGDMIERVDGDVNALSDFFSQLVIQVIANILLIIGILVALFFEGWKIGLAFSTFVFVGITLSYQARKIATPYFVKERQASQDLFGFIEERISGTQDIRSLGAEQNVMKKYYEFEEKRYRSVLKSITVSRLISVTFTGLIGFGSALVFIIGVPLFNANEITLGTVFLMNYYVGFLVFPIFEILRQLQILQRADASIERIEEILNMEPKMRHSGSDQINPDNLELSFNGVDFAYFEEKLVLKNVSFTLENKETLGLIGRTGSGKTTISRLLFRFYKLNAGQIFINGMPIENYDINDLRQKIGLVTQDVQLFNATVRNNLTFFDDDIDDEKLLEVISKLGLWSWYDTLSDGLDTKISADKVSAGQAQLIALGRIFLKDPQLIILDEASSRLDPATENIVNNAVEKLLEGRTAIIIAHRLATLKKTDKILELSEGEVKEFGSRHELLQNPQSSYSKLIKTGKEVLFS